MKIRKTNLEFGTLSRRLSTDMIVIHHTGSVHDSDPSVEQIHYSHKNGNGWAGVGYHFVVRKDGTVEIGRPEWAVGSHAYGENYHTLGIHVSGDFEAAHPTNAQIKACAELIHDLCNDYNIPCDRAHIVGHCDLMATNCPGAHLYSQLDKIISLANGITSAKIDKPPDETQGKPVETIFDLARRYESANDPAAIGHGYGFYQFTTSTVNAFVYWLKNYPDDKLANYGRALADANNFDDTWQMLGTVDPGHFGQLQDEFAKKIFFGEAADLLSKEDFHVEKHSLQMQAVIFARAIQNGVFGCVELLKRACQYPNLSYVDDANFDREFIADIYDYLIQNPSFIKVNEKLHAALVNRFKNEKADALA